MTEGLDIATNITDHGPVYTSIILFTVFSIRYFWPWFSTDFTSEQNRRWDVKHEQEMGREQQAQKLTEEIVKMTRDFQNGAREEHRRELKLVRDSIDATNKGIMEGFDRIAKMLSGAFEKQDNRIDGWMTSTAATVELMAREKYDDTIDS